MITNIYIYKFLSAQNTSLGSMEFERSISIICTVFVISTLTWFVMWKWSRRRVYELMSKIKIPPGLPFIGHIFLLLQPADRVYKVLIEYVFENGPNFGAWLVHIPLIVLGKPEDLEIVMQSQNCLSKGYFYDFTKVAIGDGLFAAHVEKWRRNRKIIQPTFNLRVLNSFIPIFASVSSICVNEVLPQYVGQKDVDWYKVFVATSIDSICQTTMGLDPNAQRSELPFAKHLERGTHAAFSRILNVLLHSDLIFNFTKSAAHLREAVAFVKDYTKNVVTEKREDFRKELETKALETEDEDAPLKRKPFLQSLLELDHKGIKFSDQQLMDEMISFLIGGTDTSAVTACFFLTMMGMHQDIQEEVYQEITSVLDADGTPTMEDLNKLELLERCMKETMRLFPPAPIIARQVGPKEVQLTDCILPPKAFILVPIIYTHRSSNYWDDPLKFDPDRFLPEAIAKRHPYSYLPFSGGLRNCIGIRYSYINLKNLMSVILRKYRIYCDYESIEGIELTNQIVIKPIHGFKIHIAERK